MVAFFFNILLSYGNISKKRLPYGYKKLILENMVTQYGNLFSWDINVTILIKNFFNHYHIDGNFLKCYHIVEEWTPIDLKGIVTIPKNYGD